MDIKIRLARKSDLKAYSELLQKTYQEAYTNDSLGLTKECFSKEVFATEDTQKYLKSNLVVNQNQKAWMAFVGKKLTGTVTVVDKGENFEIRGFYVSPEYQGLGIGKKLWANVLFFAKYKNISLDIYAHNLKTIEIYKKWGFEIDRDKAEFCRHWPEWPEGLKAKCIYMHYVNK